MGMGYGSNFADTIDTEELKKIAPQEWDALLKAVPDEEEDLEFYLEEVACGNEVPEEFGKALESFCDAVAKKSGMEIYVGYHNSEEYGDRYDDVQGVFWYVDNAYVPNPNIPRGFHQKINRVFYVTFG